MANGMKILVAYDGSECADAALDDLRRAGLPSKAIVKKMIDEAVGRLTAAALRTEVVVKEEDPKRLLIAEAESWGADCIFVGSKGMGWIDRFLLGSVSSAVATRAHCAVEVAPDQKER